jgi:hypothetical protein
VEIYRECSIHLVGATQRSSTSRALVEPSGPAKQPAQAATSGFKFKSSASAGPWPLFDREARPLSLRHRKQLHDLLLILFEDEHLKCDVRERRRRDRAAENQGQLVDFRSDLIEILDDILLTARLDVP